MHPIKRDRRGERGVSFLLVVAGIFSILAMAALAIDVATLYAANSDAQKAADAAALAGAKMFVMSSSTLGGTVAPSDVCTNGAGQSSMANVAAAAAAQGNTVGGATAQITNVACLGTTGSPGTPAPNPRIQITVGRSNLPLFFARVFGTRTASVSATATAEAFNNSGGGSSLVSVGSVKPWAIPNCQPGTAALPVGGPCTDYYIDHSNGYKLISPSSYVGTQISFDPGAGAHGAARGAYFPIDFTTSTPAPQATLCPATANACSGLSFGANPYNYIDNIACATNNQPNQRLSCGSLVQLLLPGAVAAADTEAATQCLIHSVGGTGQDTINATVPVTIDGGTNNPNPALQVNNISRSDSVVTVPVFEWNGNPCGGTPCTAPQVIGFLQLGINNVHASGRLDAVVINAVGCDPNNPGSPPVAGGGVSPIPVRLVQ